MKDIKKLKSYGKTVAASALLVGATLTGAAGLAAAQSSGSSGQATLDDYPHPFVDNNGNVDTSIVVGTDGKQADVVSAIDIAGDLGNQAFKKEKVSSGASAAVDGESLDEVTVGTDLNGNSDSLTIDASDYSGFVRKTVEDDDGNDVFVTESASIGNDVDSRINGTTTDIAVKSSGAVSYTVNYSPGFQVNDTITLLGNQYELVDVQDGGDTLKLGSSSDHQVKIGDSFTHGPYTVEVTGKTTSDPAEVAVRVSKGEQVLDTKALKEGEELTVGNNDQFTVEGDSVIFYADGKNDITLKTTYQDMTLEEGEDLPMDSNYEVPNNGINAETTDSNSNHILKSIKVENQVTTVDDPKDKDETGYVENGQSFEGPNGYFSVTNQGLTDETMTSVEFGTDHEVTFNDVNNQEHTVDMSAAVTGAAPAEDVYTGVQGDDSTGDTNPDYYPVHITDIGTNNESITLEHNEFNKEFTLSKAVSANGATKVGGTSGSYTSYADADGNTAKQDVAYQTVDTGYGFSVTVEFVDDSGSVDGDFSSGDTVDEVNIYNRNYGLNNDNSDTEASDAKFTTQNGAQLSYSNANSNVSDDGVGSSVDYVQLNENVGTSTGGAPTTNLWVTYADDSSDYSNVDSGEIGAVVATDNAKIGQALTDVQDGDSTLTHFGSGVELGSASSATVMYPDEQRYQMAAFGSTSGGDTSGDGAVSYKPTGFPAGVGTLDTEVSNSERSQNMILVGGPEVNDLTADLAEAGKTWNSTQYKNNKGVGVLDLVNDAFSDGYSALVVAGWQAEDTSAAADYLVNYNSGTDTALEGKTTAQVNTDSGELVQ